MSTRRFGGLQRRLGNTAQPDGGAVRQQQVEGGRVGHQPARRGDHGFGIDPDRLLSSARRPPVAAVAGLLPVQGLDFGGAAAGEILDLAAEPDEGEIQRLGQRLPR